MFYLTIGRTGSVSDVDFMARTRVLNKTQITLIYRRHGGDAHVAHLARSVTTRISSRRRRRMVA